MSDGVLGRWLLGVASVVMIGAVLAGLDAVGTPARQRALRLDQARVQDLGVIARGVQNHWRRYHVLPVDLGAYDVSGGRGIDRATGKPYAYSVLSDESYSLCATFDLASDAGHGGRSNPYTYVPDAPGWQHPAGQHCFVFLTDHGPSPAK
ncbi:MAG TPA: hypothetical protein VME63_13030 [Dyella sp.]|uniref:hypothetical protein n=1 Tax=Dyella sp. TaxID=1869338 RepID=UPI002B8DDD84|nr:hypothetical protein [Dyella sp.]HTV86330.1 hypothetical protein [Dyella sp.]